MAAARNYSSVARLASLQSGITNTATVATLDQVTGFPTSPFTLIIDPGRTAEEAVTCTAVVGTNITMSRGQDGTAAQPHDAGAAVRHMATARDYREPAEHISLSNGIHGLGGYIVGTSDAQVLDNKTFTPQGTDHTPLVFQAIGSQASNMVTFKDSGGGVLGFIASSGRITTSGIDGTGSSTFATSIASTVPLVAKGAVSQTASILSVRDSGNNEIFGVGAAGLNALTLSGTLTAAAINASGRISTPGVDSSSQSILTGAAGLSPLILKSPVSPTAPPLDVRINNTTVAGVNTAGMLFHGATGNVLPFKIHCGVDVLTMLDGATSQSGTVDLSSYGFTVAPIVIVTAGQGDINTIKRRVAANVIYPPTASAFSYRVIQTSNEPVVVDTTYRCYWIAIQYSTGSAAG